MTEEKLRHLITKTATEEGKITRIQTDRITGFTMMLSAVAKVSKPPKENQKHSS
jgi:hypothetical protein